MASYIILLSSLATLSLGEPESPGESRVSPRDQLLVSTEWLAKHLTDANLVILHVGDPREYPGEHIPGARLITLRDVSRPHARGELSLEMLPPAELRSRLERFGISDDSRIVVYYAKDWISPATRVVLTLDWIGLGEQTRLLDGGMQQWKADGHAVTDVISPLRGGRLSARPTRDAILADIGAVQRAIKDPSITLIDARAAVFYDGPSHGEHRAGHIPTAANLPFNTVFGDDLRLRPATELTAMFEKAGVTPRGEIVVYCHIGQQATAVIFAARSLGYSARLYDASFDEWSARTDLPVEGGRPGQHRGHQ